MHEMKTPLSFLEIKKRKKRKTKKMFRVLSIDGGGIRGIIPAKILALLEEELGRKGKSTRICDYFDMICGTSTGGIIAIGLGLGMPANDILNLYLENAEDLFPKKSFKRKMCNVIRGKSFYERDVLKRLIAKAYDEAAKESPARLGHSHTRLCIPAYDAHKGAMHVFKTCHHPELIRDYQIPAADIALSTAAAPVYFDSYDFNCSPIGGGQKISYSNLIDGGIMANNPALIGYTEAVHSLEIPVGDLAILSLGTGNNQLRDLPRTLSAKYWLYENKKFRLYDLTSSAQADYTSNLMKFLQKGVGNSGKQMFIYDRLQHPFCNRDEIGMDDSTPLSLDRLEKIGQELFGDHATAMLSTYFQKIKEPFEPYSKL